MRKRRKLIAALVVLAGVAGVWFFLLWPKPPMAYALLQIHVWNGRERPDVGQSYLREQAAHLRSPLVLNKGLSNLDSNPSIIRKHTHSVDWLAQRIKFDFPDSPDTMRVSLVLENDPEGTRLILDAIVHAYLDEVVKKEEEKRRKLGVDFTGPLRVQLLEPARPRLALPRWLKLDWR